MRNSQQRKTCTNQIKNFTLKFLPKSSILISYSCKGIKVKTTFKSLGHESIEESLTSRRGTSIGSIATINFPFLL